jgi:hypothetical protein
LKQLQFGPAAGVVATQTFTYDPFQQQLTDVSITPAAGTGWR